MPTRIAIVGASVAGSYFAYLMARNGVAVDLFDPLAPWSKPCGGGITTKAIASFPLLAGLAAEAEAVARFRLIAPSGRIAEIDSGRPLWLLPRRALNRFLLRQAVAAGARHLDLRVTAVRRDGGGWRLTTEGGEGGEASGEGGYTHLVGADGAVSTVRRCLDRPLARGELILALDYHLNEPELTPGVDIAFLGRGMGYVWAFVAARYASIGIGAPAASHRSAALAASLRQFLDRHYPGAVAPDASPMRWVIPLHGRGFLDRYRIQGDRWALIGDAAGLADPLTGEGIYYALASARLLAEAFLLDEPATYTAAVRRTVVPELEKGYAIAHDYLRPRLLNLLVGAASHSASLRDLLATYLSGEASYQVARTLLRRRRGAILGELIGIGKKFP
ncbi:MAG: hypothetical protein COW73_03985 [Nitrospirae bacterium CG18_big_fil_WC_8_21_14_2_50_70_55]|nr:NAD(P)/FAD-dependent oxidoreductase [Deltaproteobacteria bacterium]OIP64872.1 MAG: hypothetical protein AUK30_05965 [Nitrospirae bacterium CG2_30_70_394]PIQ06199.1 MAG: hypothetical protein COW73_03985 [Nitrospirae bacterium CG18_big_fil_WC_8_21_14_2_50_70_55]PIU80227.1 MAG: hypothetical protein COS73_00265 [Nitrospirae bacterium CG06_land_8_20_14_3_00_70_43]PIW83125.1 MAG: hypothetical protein COZ96_05125 [Nitrospirae bacterium CG_4_8_14_3_um_filter_70_85]PIX83969.1 MAG: hypothetical prote